MRRRLVVVALAISSMVVLAFVIPLGLLIRRQTSDRALAGAQRDAQSIATAFAISGGSAPPDGLQAVAESVVEALDPSGRVSIVLPDGSVVGAQFELEDSNLDRALSGSAFTSRFEYGAEVLIPVSLSGGSRAVVRSFVTTAELRDGVIAAWLLLGLLAVLLVSVAVVVADRLGRSIVVPVRRVADATHRFGEGERTTRLPLDGPPEIVEVSSAFNRLADRLDALLAAERESVADLSHRLRTPLAALRLQVDAVSDPQAAAQLAEQVDALEGAVTRLIEEARRPAGSDGDAASDLAAVVRHRLGFWRVLAEDQGRDLHEEILEGSATVPIAGTDLGAAFDALVENVFSHTPPGTSFSVAVRSGGDGFELRIEDGGPGFGEGAEVRRGESGSGSTGLGLDIARSSIESAGGTLIVGDGPDGGARVVARLPMAQRAS